MNDSTSNTLEHVPPIPPDDPQRNLTIVRPDDPILPHIGLVGDTYTILLSGKETSGRYCLIEMHVPAGGGPSHHRHDFEEMFTILEGEIEFTFRGNKQVVRPGETVNIPANAPHFFTNNAGQTARMLCMCTPAGQEEFFTKIGIPVASRTERPPKLDEAGQSAFIERRLKRSPRSTGRSSCHPSRFSV